MSARPYNVLFICTHNSARSILAEGLLNHLGRGRFKAWSAGNQPMPSVNPLTLQTLTQWKVPTDGFRSKNWSEFSAPDAPVMDFVFTVCDDAAEATCPEWPGQPMTARWSVQDPLADAVLSQEQRSKLFQQVAMDLKRRVEFLLALPVDKLDRLALQREVNSIGRL